MIGDKRRLSDVSPLRIATPVFESIAHVDGVGQCKGMEEALVCRAPSSTLLLSGSWRHVCRLGCVSTEELPCSMINLLAD